MKIFDIINGHAMPSPEALLVPEFKVIWDRDKSKDKHDAIRDLSYIVFMVDESINNPYRGYNSIERPRVLARDFYGSEQLEEDPKVEAAINKYREISETTSVRLLKAAKFAAQKLEDWFYSVDFKKLDDRGKPLFSSRDLSANLGRMGDILKSLNSLEEFLRKEQADSKVRGGGEVGIYEIPREDFDYGE